MSRLIRAFTGFIKNTFPVLSTNNSLCPSLPDMPGERSFYATSAAMIGGSTHIVVSGGRDGNNNTLSSVILLNITEAHDAWQSLPDMPERRRFHAMSTVNMNDRVYIVVSGGVDNHFNLLSSVIYLDVNNPSAGWQTDLPNMPIARGCCPMTTIMINGRDYIVISGGQNKNHNRLISVICLDVNNPGSGWQFLPDMPQPRIHHAMCIATIGGNDHIVVSGGTNENIDSLTSVICLDVNKTRPEWQSLPDMPERRRFHVMSTVNMDDRVYMVVSGGVDNHFNLLSSVIYLDVNNPGAGWQTDMPNTRILHAILRTHLDEEGV